MLKQLLVPTDLSEESEAFFDYAFRFAAVIDAGITVVHAFYPQPASIDGMLLVDVDQRRLQEEAFDLYVVELEEKYKAHEVAIEKNFLVGFAADKILEFANESRAYMILMNTSGSRTLKRLFGSVSVEVMKRAEIPVLLVPPEYVFRMIKRVVYADDFSDNHEKGLIYLEHIVDEFLADLVCTHVTAENDPGERMDWADLTKIKNKFKGVEIHHQIIMSPSAMKGILTIAEENDADLIIMPSKKKGFVYNLFHHSVTREIAIESTKPILVIH